MNDPRDRLLLATLAERLSSGRAGLTTRGQPILAASPRARSSMHRAFAVLLVLIVVVLSGCASTSPPQPTTRPFEDLRRLVVVASGDTTFAMTEHSAEPGRTFDEILKWGSFGSTRQARL